MSSLETKSCPVCENTEFKKKFIFDYNQVSICENCNLEFLNPQPSDERLNEIYSKEYFISLEDDKNINFTNTIKQNTANDYLEHLFQKTDLDKKKKNKILEVGCGGGEFLYQAHKLFNFEVFGVEYSDDASKKAEEFLKECNGKVFTGDIFSLSINDYKNFFDVIAFNDVLEHVRNPKTFLQRCNQLLKKNGFIYCSVPSKSSYLAKIMMNNWYEYKTEHIFYFNNSNLKQIFNKNKFSVLDLKNVKKSLTIEYVNEHFKKYKKKFWSDIIKLLTTILPKFIKSKSIKLPTGGVILIGKKRC